LFETFFENMHSEQDIRNSFWGVKTPIEKNLQGGVGILICCVGHHTLTFPTLRFLLAHLVFFFISEDYNFSRVHSINTSF